MNSKSFDTSKISKLPSEITFYIYEFLHIDIRLELLTESYKNKFLDSTSHISIKRLQKLLFKTSPFFGNIYNWDNQEQFINNLDLPYLPPTIYIGINGRTNVEEHPVHKEMFRSYKTICSNSYVRQPIPDKDAYFVKHPRIRNRDSHYDSYLACRKDTIISKFIELPEKFKIKSFNTEFDKKFSKQIFKYIIYLLSHNSTRKAIHKKQKEKEHILQRQIKLRETLNMLKEQAQMEKQEQYMKKIIKIEKKEQKRIEKIEKKEQKEFQNLAKQQKLAEKESIKQQKLAAKDFIKQQKLAEKENKKKLKQLRENKRLEDNRLAMVRTLFKR
jgi:hypothetical protein